ncbi:MAG: Hpt domain-containing protein, partial [Desulfobacterales bacterium]
WAVSATPSKLPRRVASSMQRAVLENSTRPILPAAHSLKGAAGNIGLVEFSNTARCIEDATRRGNFDGVAEAAQVLRDGLERLARDRV